MVKAKKTLRSDWNKNLTIRLTLAQPHFGHFLWFFLHPERINVTQNFAYESAKHKMSEPPTKELTLYIFPPAKDARLWGSEPHSVTQYCCSPIAK